MRTTGAKRIADWAESERLAAAHEEYQASGNFDGFVAALKAMPDLEGDGFADVNAEALARRAGDARGAFGWDELREIAASLAVGDDVDALARWHLATFVPRALGLSRASWYRLKRRCREAPDPDAELCAYIERRAYREGKAHAVEYLMAHTGRRRRAAERIVELHPQLVQHPEAAPKARRTDTCAATVNAHKAGASRRSARVR